MNTARLRRDIDTGKTGDRSPGLDPATVPLGTGGAHLEDTTPSDNKSGGVATVVACLAAGAVLATALIACVWAFVSR